MGHESDSRETAHAHKPLVFERMRLGVSNYFLRNRRNSQSQELDAFWLEIKNTKDDHISAQDDGDCAQAQFLTRKKIRGYRPATKGICVIVLTQFR
jgi:hypothetical protein